MSKSIEFKDVDGGNNTLRVGGESCLPNDIKWPTNPNGEKLTLIFSLPTNILNSLFQFEYPMDRVVSVFTTYKKGDYFLDIISYHGDIDKIDNIRAGFTKVVVHSIGESRNESDYIVPAMEIFVGEEFDVPDFYCGSLLGGNPTFLQNGNYEFDNYQFCLQMYGGDFPNGFEDIFCLSDAVGYLFLNKKNVSSDTGLFFVQYT